MKEIHRVYKADFPTVPREESLSEPVVLCKLRSDQDVFEQHREHVQAVARENNKLPARRDRKRGLAREKVLW